MISEFKDKDRFMSNFYWHDGWCVEIPFQAAKATNEKDKMYVMASKSAAQAKRRGRKIKCRSDWEEGYKEGIMLNLLRSKFKIEAMRRKLLDTGNVELSEGNWWHDNEWGDCYCEKCRLIRGKDKLGKLLMHVRQEIVLNYAFGNTEETWEVMPYDNKDV